MINLRKLAAIDIAFLGYKFVLAEYAVGVFFSAALGLFVLFRGHSFWQVCLGIYLICLGINYIPMLAYTLSIADKGSAQAELGGEGPHVGEEAGPDLGRHPPPDETTALARFSHQPFPSRLNPICWGRASSFKVAWNPFHSPDS